VSLKLLKPFKYEEELGYVDDIAFDKDNNAIICGRNSTVKIFDKTGKVLKDLKTDGGAVAVFSNGNIAVGSTLMSSDHIVCIRQPDGKEIQKISDLGQITGITVSPDDTLVVACQRELHFFSQDGKKLKDFDLDDYKLPICDPVQGIAFDSMQNMYVAGGRLYVFNKDGDHINTFGASYASDVAVDSKDRVLVATSHGKETLMAFDTDGKTLCKYKSAGIGRVALDKNGTIWTAASEDIQLFALEETE